MKGWTVLLLIPLAGCSWFGHKKPAGPPPSAYVVTGAPADAVVLLDGVAQGDPVVKGRSQVMSAPAGYHLVEVKVGDAVTYREQTYLSPGERHFVQVLTSKTD